MDLERALSDVSEIRQRIAASAIFRGFGYERLVVVAVVFGLLIAAQALMPAVLAYNVSQIVTVWGVFLWICILVNSVDAHTRSKLHHGSMAMPMLRGAMRNVVAAAVVGTIITSAIARYAPEAIWMAPAIWFLLLSLVGIASYQIMPPSILLTSLWFMICGAGYLYILGPSGQLQPWMVGMPLICGNIFAAITLFRVQGKQ